MNSTNAMKRVGYGYVSRTEQVIIEKLSREENKLQAIIYVKPRCKKCWRTQYKLKQVMPVQTITADADDYERFRKLGYRSMPVVTVFKANGTHETWCDLRLDKTKQYTE
nr:MAG: Thioredoxin [Bacteriophage sp.]